MAGYVLSADDSSAIGEMVGLAFAIGRQAAVDRPQSTSAHLVIALPTTSPGLA